MQLFVSQTCNSMYFELIEQKERQREREREREKRREKQRPEYHIEPKTASKIEKIFTL